MRHSVVWKCQPQHTSTEVGLRLLHMGLRKHTLQSSIWKKYSSWLVPWKSPLDTEVFGLRPPVTFMNLLRSLSSSCDQDFGGSKSWFQQPQVRVYSLYERAVSVEIYLDTRTSFSERLRLIFKLSTYILIWKTEDNLIFLFACTLTKRDQYINQVSFPTNLMGRKTPKCYEKTGFFMNIAMSKMLIIQTIREKQEDQQMTMKRLWIKRLSILCGDRWESWVPQIPLSVQISGRVF